MILIYHPDALGVSVRALKLFFINMRGERLYTKIKSSGYSDVALQPLRVPQVGHHLYSKLCNMIFFLYSSF